MPKVDKKGRTTVGRAAETVASIAPRQSGVLVVESDPDLQWRLARMLTVEGHRVVGTSSADGALALLEQWPVDLILVAEALPDMDGLSLASTLQERCPSTPVILMTEDDPKRPVAARLAGAVACLTKPFHMDALRELVASIQHGPVLEPTP